MYASDDLGPEKRTRPAATLISEGYRFVRPHASQFILCIVLFLLWIGSELAIPMILGWAIDTLKNEGSRAQVSDLIPFAMMLAAATGVRMISSALRNLELARFTQYILSDMRRELYDSIQRHPFRFHNESKVGGLITTVTQDIQRLRMLYDTVFFGFLDVFVYLAGAFAIGIWIEWRLGLLVMVGFIASSFMIVRFSEELRPRWRKSWDKYDDVTSVLQENIAGVQVVRAFAREDEEIVRFNERSKQFLDNFLETVGYWSTRMPLVMFLFGLLTPLVLLWGGYLVLAGTMGVGALATFMIYLGGIGWRMRMVGELIGQLQSALTGAERVLEVLQHERDITEPTKPTPLPPGGGEIVFEDVSFAYGDGDPILHGLGFRIAPGEKVALVGKTGAGKTSLVSLLPRFYDPKSGSVRIDGVDVRQLALKDLRQSIAFVFQESFLFSATIEANIAYSRPTASPEEVAAAAKAAQADAFIERLANGYKTIVGERGLTLSGGQRQRISIARALLKNPRILVLDDATAAVDPSTEREIFDAIENLIAGRTTIIIAHRLASVKRADRIIVLEEGRISGIGTHDELIRTNRLYREIHDLQFHDEEESNVERVRDALLASESHHQQRETSQRLGDNLTVPA